MRRTEQLSRPATWRRAQSILRGFGLAALLGLALGGCTLPRSGPTASEILAAGSLEEGAVQIVAVSPDIARVASAEKGLAFGSEFVNAGAISADGISPGDRVSVTVWENVDTGLLAGVGQKVTVLEELQVDEQGRIFVPYAGQIQAGGRTPEQLRADITAALEDQTPEPQVEVRRVTGVGSTVSVMGGVGKQGVYPIEAPTRRLSGMLAAAGGVTIVPEIAQVTVDRGGRSGTVWLQDLYDNPRNDIALRAGDRVIVEQDRRSFTALGASTGQRRVPFTKRDLSVLEALAEAGGLNGASADPTGIFLFRDEEPEVLRRLGGVEGAGPQRVAYVIDLTEPLGVFAAREFIVRDEDTIYVTEAPVAAWSRVIGIAGNAVRTGGAAAALGAAVETF
jgi:polysaccharide export outer membrane protein